MTFDRIARVDVDAHDLTIISGPDPERFAIEIDAARSIGFCLEGAQHVPLVTHQVGFVAGALIDDPEAVRGCLQSVRLRVVTGRFEHDLDFADLACGNFAEIQRERPRHGSCYGHREECSAVHTC